MDKLKPARIDDHWGIIKPVLDRHFDGDPLIIFDACLRHQAWLYVNHEGFVVLAPETNPDTGVKELLVWFAGGDGECLIEKHQSEVIEIARDKGCDNVVSRTAIDGLIRKLPLHGWRQRYVEFALDVRRPPSPVAQRSGAEGARAILPPRRRRV